MWSISIFLLHIFIINWDISMSVIKWNILQDVISKLLLQASSLSFKQENWRQISVFIYSDGQARQYYHAVVNKYHHRALNNKKEFYWKLYYLTYMIIYSQECYEAYTYFYEIFITIHSIKKRVSSAQTVHFTTFFHHH